MVEKIIHNLRNLEKDLQDRIDNIAKDLSKNHSADFAEQAVERENDEVLIQIQNDARNELAQVKQSLKRHEEGGYGICITCGKEISSERLEAMPFATQCIDCAS